MLSCDDVTRLVSQSYERELSWRERAAMRVHLWYCVGCRRFRRQLALLHAALMRRREQADVRLSPAARERLRRALGQSR